MQPAPCTILVVDDDEQIRESLAQHLDDEGYVTVQASSGVEAMRQLRERLQELILLDMMMPRMLDGFGVLEAMQTLLGQSRPPVILVTAVVDADRVRNAIHFGVVDYLVKPFKLRDVTARVEKALLGQRRTVSPPAAVPSQHEQTALLQRVSATLIALEPHRALALLKLQLDLPASSVVAQDSGERVQFLAEAEKGVRSGVRRRTSCCWALAAH